MIKEVSSPQTVRFRTHHPNIPSQNSKQIKTLYYMYNIKTKQLYYSILHVYTPSNNTSPTPIICNDIGCSHLS